MKKAIFVLFLLLSVMPASASADATSTVITTTGAGTWVVPDGVSSVTVEVWGGGESGNSDTGGQLSGCASGSGGGYSKATISVTPSDSIPYFIGSGGTAPSQGSSSCNSRNAGMDSMFSASSTVLAKGGGTGGAGTGGQASSGVGDVKYSGGNGFGAVNQYTSGASSAGDLGNGVNGVSGNTPTACVGTSGTDDTLCGRGSNGSSNSALQPGGGGGSDAGGGGSKAGAHGQLRITYDTASPAGSSSTSTPDQTQQNTFNGFVVFFMACFTMLFLMKRR